MYAPPVKIPIGAYSRIPASDTKISKTAPQIVTESRRSRVPPMAAAKSKQQAAPQITADSECCCQPNARNLIAMYPIGRANRIAAMVLRRLLIAASLSQSS